MALSPRVDHYPFLRLDTGGVRASGVQPKTIHDQPLGRGLMSVPLLRRDLNSPLQPQPAEREYNGELEIFLLQPQR
jgi:hypothetical protein